MKNQTVLGIDAGFTYLGWAAYDVPTDMFNRWGVIATSELVQKSEAKNKKRKVLVSQLYKDIPRIKKISKELSDILKAVQPVGIVLETPYGFPSMGSRGVYTAGLVNGIIFTTVSNALRDRDTYFQTVDPRAIKRHFTKKGDTSKEAVILGVKRRWPKVTHGLDEFNKGKISHVADAMAAIGVSAESEEGLVYLLNRGGGEIEATTRYRHNIMNLGRTPAIPQGTVWYLSQEGRLSDECDN